MESMPICRTCLSAENLGEIFEEFNEEQLLLVTGIKILPNDEKPQSVCAPCKKLIDSALTLRRQSLYADNMLKMGEETVPTTSKIMSDDEFDCNVDYSSDDFSDNFIVDNSLPNMCQEKPIEKKKRAKSRREIKNLKKDKDSSCHVRQKHRTKKKTNHSNIFDISSDIMEDVLRNRQTSIDVINAESFTDDVFQEYVSASKNHGGYKKSKQNTDLGNCTTDIDSLIKISQQKVKTENFETDFVNNIITNNVKDGKHNTDLEPGLDLKEIYKTKWKTESFNVDDFFNPIPDSKKAKSLDTVKKNYEIETNLKDLLKKPKDTTSNNEIYNIIYKDICVKKKGRSKKRDKFWGLAVKPIDKHGLIKCSVCSKEFKFNYFCKHATTHFEAEFTCEMCGHKFSNVHTMRYHQQRKHGAERKHACQQCEYRAVFKEELVNHQHRCHTGERPFICDVCGDTFCQRRTLVQHMRKHYGVNKFECDFCGKLFASRSQLSSHRTRFHLLRYSFLCYLCPYQATSRPTVRNHLEKLHSVPKNEQLAIKFLKEKR